MNMEDNVYREKNVEFVLKAFHKILAAVLRCLGHSNNILINLESTDLFIEISGSF